MRADLLMSYFCLGVRAADRLKTIMQGGHHGQGALGRQTAPPLPGGRARDLGGAFVDSTGRRPSFSKTTCSTQHRPPGVTHTDFKKSSYKTRWISSPRNCLMFTLSAYLGDSLDSSRSFLNSSLASSNLLFFSLYSSFILVLTNCSNILRHTLKRIITREHTRNEISCFAHNRKQRGSR